METLIKILINASSVLLSSYLLAGVRVDGFVYALIAAVALGIVNIFIKPLLILLTLPATILTLGLFVFVINALLVLLVARFVPGFHVDGFWWALLFSFIFSIIKFILDAIFRVN